MKNLIRSLFVVLATITSTSAVQAQLSLHEQASLLGSPLKIDQTGIAENSADGKGQKLVEETKTTVFGRTVNLMKFEAVSGPAAETAAEATADGVVSGTGGTVTGPDTGIVLNQHDLYIGGVRIWAGKLTYDKGSVAYSGGVAPTQVPIPLLIYPLGPIILQVDAGFEFEGMVEARLQAGPSYPLTDSVIAASLESVLYAGAYLDAYAKFLFVKAGVGGRIDVLRAQAGFNTTFYLNGLKPLSTSYGWARVLDGHVYGFVDTKLLFGSWRRILQKDFFNWAGLCVTFKDGIKSCN